jgi:CRISPR-associated protein Cmr3
MMTNWEIQGLDPMLFSDGRPLSAGAFSAGLPLPMPSSLAGAARTRHGQDHTGRWAGNPETVRQLSVHGPFLLMRDLTGGMVDWLMPAPADAVEMQPAENGEHRTIRWQQPLEVPAGAQVSSDGDGSPVGLATPDLRKPYKNACPLWRWSELSAWLTEPGDRVVPEQGWGVLGTPVEMRTHVSLDPDSGTAADGMLFTTKGRRWLVPAPDDQRVLGSLSVVLRTEATDITSGMDAMGGERRMVSWSPCREALPRCPERVLAAAEAGAVRLMLITPAHFSAGSIPSTPFGAPEGSEIVGQVNYRPQVVSGWDMEHRRPKPTRRLVPAGAMFFLRLGGDRATRRRWAEQVWLAPVSENAQACRDGFGLAVLGCWSGNPAPINVI